MKQNISSFDFYTKIAPSNSRLKSRVCDGKIIKEGKMVPMVV